MSDYSALRQFVETCRELGHGAIRSGEAPLDVLDRQLDHILGRIASLEGDPCPVCGRPFRQVSRHLRASHPEYVEERLNA